MCDRTWQCHDQLLSGANIWTTGCRLPFQTWSIGIHLGNFFILLTLLLTFRLVWFNPYFTPSKRGIWFWFINRTKTGQFIAQFKMGSCGFHFVKRRGLIFWNSLIFVTQILVKWYSFLNKILNICVYELWHWVNGKSLSFMTLNHFIYNSFGKL